MDLAELLSYVAMFVGLASSLFFGIGIYNMKDSTLFEISVRMWGRGEKSAQNLIEQKYDFLTGASLLVISFSSQLASKFISGSSLHLKILEAYFVGLIAALCLSLLFIALVSSVANRLKEGALTAHTKKIKEDL